MKAGPSASAFRAVTISIGTKRGGQDGGAGQVTRCLWVWGLCTE